MKFRRLLPLILLSLLAVIGCRNAQNSTASETFTVGVNSDFNREIWEDVGERLKSQNIKLDIKRFSEYVQADTAVDEGIVDTATYQYSPFLLDTAQNHDLAVVPIGYALITPLGIWAPKNKPLKTLEDVPTNGIVAIGNDPVNMDHQLRTFEAPGLIRLSSGAHQLYTTDAISANPISSHLNRSTPPR